MSTQLSQFGADRQVPVHCEAYLAFAIKSADRHWRDDEPCCEWEDRFGQLVGQMQLTALQGDRLGISYAFGLGATREQLSLGLRIARCRLPSGRYEARAFCPECRQVRDRLWFRWLRWGCQRCQELVQRRSLLGELDRVVVRRDQLLRKVYGPGSEAKSALATLGARRELSRLTQLLDDAGAARLVSPPLDHLVSARWFNPDKDTDGPGKPLAALAYLHVPRPRSRLT